MDDIANGFVSCGISKNFTIGVKNLHLFEVSIADTDNDATEWHSRESNELSLGLLHIMTVAICDDNDDVVLTVTVEASPIHARHNVALYLL